MSVVLAVDSVTKRIGARTIVDNISFEVKQGEVFGLLGPNGAGKTTTIRMLVGLALPTNGRISVCGHDVHADHRAAMKHIGTIVENPELYPYLSGLENLWQFARLSGKPDEAKIQSVVELVGLGDRIQEKVRRYSLGMRQRLGLAQALLHDPSLLILDEPTNGLDPAGMREFRELLRTLAGRGTSILISSHLLGEIELVCDRIGVIQNGKWMKTATVTELRSGNGTSTLYVHVDSASRALAVMKGGAPYATAHAVTETCIAVEHSGGELNPLLELLIVAGVSIIRIEEKTTNLEDVFLDMTGGAQHG